MGHRGILFHIRDVNCLTLGERAPQLGIAVEVDHIVPDARIFEARNQAGGLVIPFREKDRAPIEAEHLAQSSGD